MIRRKSGANRFNIYNFSVLMRLNSVLNIISKRDDSIVDALSYFEAVQRFEDRGDILSFSGNSHCASKGGLQ